MLSGEVSVPDRVRRALAEWGTFPVDEEPRPLVLLGERVRPLGFPSGEAKQAFLNGAIEALPGFPPQVLEAMRLPARRNVGTTLVMADASLEEYEFVTDRGRRPLPAWRVHASGVDQPIWVLDPAMAAYIWLPSGQNPEYVPVYGDRATTADDRTITLSFSGSPEQYVDYPGARVVENLGAVAILPISVSKVPAGQILPAVGATREITTILSEPLGTRVLLGPMGTPVTVET